MKKKTKSRENKLKWKQLSESIREIHPSCEICGNKDHLQVHHVVGKFYHKSLLRFAPENLIVLCPKHHFEFHHNPISTIFWFEIHRRAEYLKILDILGEI